MLDTYQGTFKEKYSYWEGVIEIRKLLFCSFYLIHNNVNRLILCTIFSILILVHHKSTHPFAHENSNKVETLSLSLLCMACVTNSIKSFFSQLGLIVEPNTPTEQILFLLNRLDRIFTILLILFIFLIKLFDILKILYLRKKT